MKELLPENFRLPGGDDYDDHIRSLDDDITVEGGVRSFLGMIRYERRNWESFNSKVLYPLALHALSLEEKNEAGITRDRERKIANSALSGMIFGHIINETTYPSLNVAYRPYRHIYIDTDMLGEVKSAYDRTGGHTTVRGRQIGLSAMAGSRLDLLKPESVETIHNWSKEAIEEQGYRSNFVTGIGLSLYASWDVYNDALIDQERHGEADYADSTHETDGGSS